MDFTLFIRRLSGMNKRKEPLIKLPLLLIRFHYPVHIPLGSMHPLAQPGQDAAQAVDGHAPHDRRMGGFHAFE